MNDDPRTPYPPDSQPESVMVSLPSAPPYLTYVLIGITVFFYILQIIAPFIFGFDLVTALLAKDNELIRNGQLWRLLTPALVHGSITHIGFNMYALFSLGSNLENFYGRGRFLLLYVLGAFAGNVLSFLFTSSPAVGASTAIFGLIGAEGIFLYQNRGVLGERARRALGNVIFIALFNLFVIGSLSFIDNWGHIGGLVGGLMFSSFAGPLWVLQRDPLGYELADQRTARDVAVGATVTLLIFSALAMWGLTR